MTYAICYRTGGTHDCKWTKLSAQYPTREEALDRALAIEAAGYKANVHKDGDGLPVGWEPGLVDWENDVVTYSPMQTHHVKGF